MSAHAPLPLASKTLAKLLIQLKVVYLEIHCFFKIKINISDLLFACLDKLIICLGGADDAFNMTYLCLDCETFGTNIYNNYVTAYKNTFWKRFKKMPHNLTFT